MRIREAEIDDAPVMGNVTVETFFFAHRDQIPSEVLEARRKNWTVATSAAAWERTLRGIADCPNSRECVCVAENGRGEIIGVAMGASAESGIECGVGSVLALSVHPKHQRLGAGRLLVMALAAYLAQHGMTTLHIETLAANAPAHRFYEALGGRVFAEREFEDEGHMLPSVVFCWDDITALLSPSGPIS